MSMSFPTLSRLDELVDLITCMPGLFVRYSSDPDGDRRRPSVDRESGLELPGLPVQQLYPEPWWTRSLHDWVARQLWRSLHLSERGLSHQGWVLLGQVVGRGPDAEPLVTDVEPVARLGDELLAEALDWYQTRFSTPANATTSAAGTRRSRAATPG